MGMHFENLYASVKALLANCGAFAGDEALRALFADPRLCEWQRDLPYVRSREQRVAETIRYLHGQYNAAHENGLVVLLQVLGEQAIAGDGYPSPLSEMAGRVAQAIRKDNRQKYNKALYGLDFEPSLPYAGEVIAGTGDVALNYIDVLTPGESYYLTVVGDSMEYEGYFEGDRIVMRVFNAGEWPGEKDLIVTKYLPYGAEPEFGADFIGSELQGPTLKYFHHELNGEYHLGWRKDNATWDSAPWRGIVVPGNRKKIVTRYIAPIGKVIAQEHPRAWQPVETTPWRIIGGEA
ncbi:MAG TPA: hypothetical protein PLJ78_15550 [Anaerolineae bacterium]|nr:hypothetical protein [Anaerolineae bacterium]HQK15347.1 hypothetical protein [Anaerolineae bacterium]